MSIHKAKGLGFPVVILLLYGECWQPPDYFLAEGENGVRVLKITAKLAGWDEELDEIYGERKGKDWAGMLNTLYVAMTRARAELYVIGVRRPRDNYPFDLLDASLPEAPEDGRPGGLRYRSSDRKPDASPAPARGDRPRAARARVPGLFELRRTPANPSTRIRRGGPSTDPIGSSTSPAVGAAPEPTAGWKPRG
jgi:ATP-dependent exoDNAse (exonuclease V) beta subunit